jgi:photosystem II stability/assembly factor-like uncharacterized protein
MNVDPVTPGVVYLGSHYGLFISTDDGKNWPQERGYLHRLMITAIGTSRIHSETIGFVGVASTGGDFGENGIYLTHDRGLTWTRAIDPPELPKDTQRYLIAPLYSERTHWAAIFVGAGLYFSFDDGKTWELRRPLTSDKEAQRVFWASSANTNHFLLGSTLGLYRSEDGGNTWAVINTISGVDAIVSAPSDPNIIYVSSNEGILKSADGGKSFTLMSKPISRAGFGRLVVSHQNPQLLYAQTGQEIWRSSDSGSDWTLQYTLSITLPMSLLIAPDNDQHLYVGFYAPARAHESIDGGKSWREIAR